MSGNRLSKGHEAVAAGRWPEEKLVRWLWEGRRWREPLCTSDGLALAVIDSGQPTANVGPDYRGATIRLADCTLHGDVELHVRASDWARHHHAEDPGYNEVILQVVLWNDATHCERNDGESVPLLALAPFIEGSWERLSPLASGSSHACSACRRAVRERGEEAALAQLAELGLARLRAKAAVVAGEIERKGAFEALFAAILAAVALPAKGEWPRQVAESLPLDTLPRDQNALAGLLEESWKAFVPPRRGYRPSGAPGPRLRVIASLVARWREDLATGASEAVLASREAPQRLEKTLQEAGLTPAQAVEWSANAVLPWAVARGQVSHQPALVEAAETIFVALPKAQEYGVTKRHAEALFGQSGAGKVKKVAVQQGLLHLEKTLCPQGACPWQGTRHLDRYDVGDI